MMSNKYKPYFVSAADQKDPAIMAVIEAHFDHETDVEEMEIHAKKAADAQQKGVETYARKLCWVRVLQSPLDFILVGIFFGPGILPRKFKLIKDMTKYIFKRISYRELIQSIEKNS